MSHCVHEQLGLTAPGACDKLYVKIARIKVSKFPGSNVPKFQNFKCSKFRGFTNFIACVLEMQNFPASELQGSSYIYKFPSQPLPALLRRRKVFAVCHEIPFFLFHLCQTLLRVCGHAQTFGTSLWLVLSRRCALQLLHSGL